MTTCFLVNTQDVAMRLFAGRKIYTACIQQMPWPCDLTVIEEGQWDVSGLTDVRFNSKKPP